MTFADALDLVASRHARFRLLCSDEWPDHMAYRRLVFDLAGSPLPDPPVVPLAQALEAHRLVRLCPYRSTAGCGCSGANCAVAGKRVSHRDCLDCMRNYGLA